MTDVFPGCCTSFAILWFSKKRTDQYVFWCQGEETVKEHPSDNCCWLWITDCPDLTLMEMFASMPAGLHVCVRRALRVVCVRPAGVLLFDRSQGFWLSHTIPHFPSFPERGYLYPSSGKVNGQTALCITHHYDQFLQIGEWTLMKQQALTYSSSEHIPNLQNSLFAEPEKTFTQWPWILSVLSKHTDSTPNVHKPAKSNDVLRVYSLIIRSGKWNI